MPFFRKVIFFNKFPCKNEKKKKNSNFTHNVVSQKITRLEIYDNVLG